MRLSASDIRSTSAFLVFYLHYDSLQVKVGGLVQKGGGVRERWQHFVQTLQNRKDWDEGGKPGRVIQPD